MHAWRMHERSHVLEKYSMLYVHILHVYILVLIDTLAQMSKAFVTLLYKCQAIRETIVQMSEYSLMGNYSLVGYLALIM